MESSRSSASWFSFLSLVISRDSSGSLPAYFWPIKRYPVLVVHRCRCASSVLPLEWLLSRESIALCSTFLSCLPPDAAADFLPSSLHSLVSSFLFLLVPHVSFDLVAFARNRADIAEKTKRESGARSFHSRKTRTRFGDKKHVLEDSSLCVGHGYSLARLRRLSQ